MGEEMCLIAHATLVMSLCSVVRGGAGGVLAGLLGDEVACARAFVDGGIFVFVASDVVVSRARCWRRASNELRDISRVKL